MDGSDPDIAMPYLNPSNDDQEALNAMAALLIFTRAINQGWEADYANSDQRKWYPYFVWDSSVSAFRFDVSYYGWTFAYAYCGARLVFETKELSDYAGNNPEYLKYMNTFLTISKKQQS